MAKNDQALLFQPLKKFDFPEPFTPTTHHPSPISITNCVYSRLEQLWILRSRIAPKALDNHLFNIHYETIFGSCSNLAGNTKRAFHSPKDFKKMQFHYVNSGARSALVRSVEDVHEKVGKPYNPRNDLLGERKHIFISLF